MLRKRLCELALVVVICLILDAMGFSNRGKFPTNISAVNVTGTESNAVSVVKHTVSNLPIVLHRHITPNYTPYWISFVYVGSLIALIGLFFTSLIVVPCWRQQEEDLLMQMERTGAKKIQNYDVDEEIDDCTESDEESDFFLDDEVEFSPPVDLYFFNE